MVDGAECGSRPDHLPALVQAEDLCINAVLGARRQRMAAPEDTFLSDTRIRELQIAGLTLDAALSPSVSDSQAEEYFGDAEHRLEDFLERNDTRLTLLTRAALLDAHLPAFAARRHKQQPATDDIDHIRSYIVNLAGDVKAAPVHTASSGHLFETAHEPCLKKEGERLGMLVKIGFHLLCLREKQVLHPSTLRESHSGDPSQNHDGSILTDEGRVPIKVINTRLNIDGHRAMVVKFMRYTNGTDSMSVIDQLIQEANGWPLATSQTRELDYMGGLLQRDLAKYLQKQQIA